jgi:hypothetical protein
VIVSFIAGAGGGFLCFLLLRAAPRIVAIRGRLPGRPLGKRARRQGERSSQRVVETSSPAGLPRPQPEPARAQAANTGIGEPLVVGEQPSRVPSLLPEITGSHLASMFAEGAQTDGITVRMAGSRGRDHMADGRPIEDACGVHVDSRGHWLLIAVADGVSASPNAHAAARAAVDVVMRIGPGWLSSGASATERGWARLFEEVADEVDKRTRGLPPSHEGPRRPGIQQSRSATTLSILAVPSGRMREREVVYGSVGDTEILALPVDGQPGGCRWLLAATGDEQPGTEHVDSLPGQHGRFRWGRSRWASGEVLLVATDGFSKALGPGNELAGHLTSTWRTPPPVLDFLRQIDFRLATFNDDRAVVALWQGEHDASTR